MSCSPARAATSPLPYPWAPPASPTDHLSNSPLAPPDNFELGPLPSTPPLDYTLRSTRLPSQIMRGEWDDPDEVHGMLPPPALVYSPMKTRSTSIHVSPRKRKSGVAECVKITRVLRQRQGDHGWSRSTVIYVFE